jgi:hypothetical protein
MTNDELMERSDALTDISGHYALAQTADDLWLLSFDRPLCQLTLPSQDSSRTGTVRADCDDVLEEYFGVAKQGVTC